MQLGYIANYNAQDPQPSHFTQVVWKATTQVGCAVKDCTGIFPASYGVRLNFLFIYLCGTTMVIPFVDRALLRL
jgi:hypothetical protein